MSMETVSGFISMTNHMVLNWMTVRKIWPLYLVRTPETPDLWLSKRSMTKIRFRYRTLMCLMVRMVIRRSIMYQKEARWSTRVQTTKWWWWNTWCRLQGWSRPNKAMWSTIKLRKLPPGVKSYTFSSQNMVLEVQFLSNIIALYNIPSRFWMNDVTLFHILYI